MCCIQKLFTGSVKTFQKKAFCVECAKVDPAALRNINISFLSLRFRWIFNWTREYETSLVFLAFCFCLFLSCDCHYHRGISSAYVFYISKSGKGKRTCHESGTSDTSIDISKLSKHTRNNTKNKFHHWHHFSSHKVEFFFMQHAWHSVPRFSS